MQRLYGNCNIFVVGILLCFFISQFDDVFGGEMAENVAEMMGRYSIIFVTS